MLPLQGPPQTLRLHEFGVVGVSATLNLSNADGDPAEGWAEIGVRKQRCSYLAESTTAALHEVRLSGPIDHSMAEYCPNTCANDPALFNRPFDATGMESASFVVADGEASITLRCPSAFRRSVQLRDPAAKVIAGHRVDVVLEGPAGSTTDVSVSVPRTAVSKVATPSGQAWSFEVPASLQPGENELVVTWTVEVSDASCESHGVGLSSCTLQVTNFRGLRVTVSP